MKKYSTAMTALVVTMMLGGATAWAGARWGTEVTIDMVNRKAEGTMANVRASGDVVQTIGCVIRADLSAPASVTCYATDGTGLAVQCTTSQASFVQAASAMTSYSNVAFKWDAPGTCTYLSVGNLSTNAPVAP